MTVAELIEKLSQCSPDALVVVEDNECGFDADWSVLILDADVNRTSRPAVHYASKYLVKSHDWNRQRVVALTAHGHGSGFNVVEL